MNLGKQTFSLGEFLASVDYRPTQVPAQQVIYHRHCHQLAVLEPDHEIALLRAAVRDAPTATVVADGFSCREQLRQLGNVRAQHLAELLASRPVLA